MKNPELIGKSIPRLDARQKVTGRGVYTDDLKFPGMLHGALVRSPLAHGKIKSIDTQAAAALTGVKDVITAKDTPCIKYGNWRLVPSSQDELPLCLDKVRFIGDEVAAVCARDRATALCAAELIEVEYEELPAVFTVEDSTAEGAPLIHEESKGNVSLVRNIEYGNLEEQFDRAHYVREDEFKVHAVSHAYLEPCSSIAVPDEGGRVTLYTSTQTPYIVQCLLAQTLGIPENHVRVMKVQVGGGFGGKMELRPWEFCAGFMALRTGRPVKFTLTRADELAFGRRRHGMSIYSKVGFDQGRQASGQGLPGNAGRRRLQRHGPHRHLPVRHLRQHALQLPAYRYFGRHVYTNKPPASAMRGFGAPQAALCPRPS